MEGGATLSQALRLSPVSFPNIFIAFVEAGEQGGMLTTTLGWAATFHEKELRLISRVRAAMNYPLFLMTATFGMLFVIVHYVFPSFLPLFKNDKGGPALPLLSQVVFGIVEALSNPIIVTLLTASMAGAIWTFAYLCRTQPEWRERRDALLLDLPLLGALIMKVNTCRFCRTLSSLLEAGVDMTNSLTLARGIVDNQVIADEIARVTQRMRDGTALDEAIAERNMFPRIVGQFFATGLHLGRLDSMLTRLSELYDLEVESTLDHFTVLLEPAIVTVLGFVMGILMLAIFLPLYGMMSSLAPG